MPKTPGDRSVGSGGASAPLASSQPTIPFKPIPVELSSRVLECPHILEAIVAYTPRATQVACLRVSLSMHDAAGRSLYRNVHIGGRAGAT